VCDDKLKLVTNLVVEVHPLMIVLLLAESNDLLYVFLTLCLDSAHNPQPDKTRTALTVQYMWFWTLKVYREQVKYAIIRFGPW